MKPNPIRRTPEQEEFFRSAEFKPYRELYGLLTEFERELRDRMHTHRKDPASLEPLKALAIRVGTVRERIAEMVKNPILLESNSIARLVEEVRGTTKLGSPSYVGSKDISQAKAGLTGLSKKSKTSILEGLSQWFTNIMRNYRIGKSVKLLDNHDTKIASFFKRKIENGAEPSNPTAVYKSKRTV